MTGAASRRSLMVADDLVRRYSLGGFLRRLPFTPSSLSITELEVGCRAFEAEERRDSIYEVSTFLIREWRHDPVRLVSALTVLLLVWNSAFYRYGVFDEQLLEDWL